MMHKTLTTPLSPCFKRALIAFSIIFIITISLGLGLGLGLSDRHKQEIAESFKNIENLILATKRICNEYIPFEKTPRFNIMPGTIFISIASYRDSECSNTINSIYSNAKWPKNVFIGICEQNKYTDEYKGELCIKPEFEKLYSDNIKITRINYIDAKGPTYARYYCSKLWSGQEYYFQIDSHTSFEKNWDENLIKMIEQCRYKEKNIGPNDWGLEGSKKPVLSAYPSTAEQLKTVGFPVMDSCKINDNNDLPIYFAGFWNIESPRPLKSPKPLVAAGYMFLDASFLYDIQYDPYLSGLFQGEETLFSARLYTNGYDIFAPNIKICSHHYNREGPMYHKDMPDFKECQKLAEKKVLFMLGLLPDSEKKVLENNPDFMQDYKKYGLGSQRTLGSFWENSGIVVKNNKLIKCINDAR